MATGARLHYVESRVTMDLRLDTTTGDLYLDSTGSTTSVTGREAIAQHVLIRLRFFLGEWFLDRREGVPYWEQILVRNPDIAAVQEAFRQTVARTPGIASVRTLVLALDGPSRTLTISRLDAVTTEGEAITASDFGPFVLDDAG